MNIARNHISKSIREYRIYKESFLPGQIKGMLFLTGLFGLYAIVAPIVLGSMMHFYINSVVEGQFTFLVFACGIPFVGFAYMLWSKKLSYKVKSILYEILMAMIFLAIGVIYPYYALTKTYLGGDYADYTVFFIIALVMLITFEVHPFLFVGGFGLSIVSIIVWMNGMDFILPKQVYNLLIFSIATLILYIVKYMARVKSHMRGLRIAEMQKQREEFMVQLTHEMRTPLNAVLGKNQMILADTAEDNTRVLSKQINGSGRMLLSLINDILDRAKLESGKMNIVVSEYNPYEMASDVEV